MNSFCMYIKVDAPSIKVIIFVVIIFAEKIVASKIKMYRHNYITAIRGVYKGFSYGYYDLSR